MISPERQRQAKWDLRYLYLAQFVSGWSKDPSTKVGSVIVRPDMSIAGIGFNGFPRGMEDSAERYADRDEKYARALHAEENAILNARERLEGYTIYNYPLAPCTHCAVQIIQAGIKRVVAPVNDNPRWNDSLARAQSYFAECGVVFDSYMGIKNYQQ